MPRKDNVANVLERETEVTIDNWYGRVEREKDLISLHWNAISDAPIFRRCSATW
jgi:hypothetical protein